MQIVHELFATFITEEEGQVLQYVHVSSFGSRTSYTLIYTADSWS